MPHQVIVHIIGTTAMILVFTAISLYAFSVLAQNTRTLEKELFQRIADSLAAQIYTIVNMNSNVSYMLDYPPAGIGGKEYLIIIGRGADLANQYPILRGTGIGSSNSYYVVVMDLYQQVYSYSEIKGITQLKNENGEVITVSVFSSKHAKKLIVSIYPNRGKSVVLVSEGLK